MLLEPFAPDAQDENGQRSAKHFKQSCLYIDEKGEYTNYFQAVNTEHLPVYYLHSSSAQPQLSNTDKQV